MVIFNLEKLHRIQQSYIIKIKISTKLKGEGSEGSEGSMQDATSSGIPKTLEDFDNSSGKDKKTSKELEPGRFPIDPASSQEPSEPSQPSPETAVVQINQKENTKVNRVEEFFKDEPGIPWKPLPEHDLVDSPCYSIIQKDKFKTSGQTYYICVLHPDFPYIDIQGIEHHCKYKEPEKHRTEILLRIPRQPNP